MWNSHYIGACTHIIFVTVFWPFGNWWVQRMSSGENIVNFLLKSELLSSLCVQRLQSAQTLIEQNNCWQVDRWAIFPYPQQAQFPVLYPGCRAPSGCKQMPCLMLGPVITVKCSLQSRRYMYNHILVTFVQLQLYKVAAWCSVHNGMQVSWEEGCYVWHTLH